MIAVQVAQTKGAVTGGFAKH
ncbi:MAG: hypothetical protein ACD_39C01919G0001, partial [uncultured bacterium]